MGDKIPGYIETQLRKMHNVVYVVRAYKPDSCLDDQVIAYDVPEDIFSFLKQCSGCLHPDPKPFCGGQVFYLPAGTVQLIPHFMVWINSKAEMMTEKDVEKLMSVQKHCL